MRDQMQSCTAPSSLSRSPPPLPPSSSGRGETRAGHRDATSGSSRGASQLSAVDAMEAAPPLALAYWCRCPRGCNRAGNGDCCYCDLCYHDGTWCKCNCEGCRAPAPPLFMVQESWDAYGEEDCDGVVLDRILSRGASQPATGASTTVDVAQALDDHSRDPLGMARFLEKRVRYSAFLCPCPTCTRRGETWTETDLCWGPLEVLSGRPDLYILRCGRCSALYREADVSRLPRRYYRQGVCGRRVRSISCPL